MSYQNHLFRRPDPMRAFVLFVPLLITVSAAALAQPALAAGGIVKSPLPSPNLSEDVKPSDALRAAEAGAAQEALEMAQTRMLDRSVALGRTNNPSDNPTVEQISRALQALAAHDLEDCVQLIRTAIATATAQGL
jgi:hypothetical protein